MCAFYRTSALSVPNTGSGMDFNGVSVNIYSHQCWTRYIPTSVITKVGLSILGTCLFIFDDLENDAYYRGLECDLFTKSSHHRKISVAHITQNIFHQSKLCRDISLNAKYLVLLKTLEIETSSPVWHKNCSQSIALISTIHI